MNGDVQLLNGGNLEESGNLGNREESRGKSQELRIKRQESRGKNQDKN